MNTKELNYEEAISKLRTLIIQIPDPYLVMKFNDWINDNLHKVAVNYTTSREMEEKTPDGFLEHHINRTLVEKLMNEASTIAFDRTNEYLGYPYGKTRELSMVILGRKNETKSDD